MAKKPEVKSPAQIRINGETVAELAKKAKLSDNGKRINDVVSAHMKK